MSPTVNLSWAWDLASDSVAIALLGLLEALAIAKAIANQTRQPLDFNRQCLAEGVANLTGSFFQCLPGSGFAVALRDQFPGRRGDPVFGHTDGRVRCDCRDRVWHRWRAMCRSRRWRRCCC